MRGEGEWREEQKEDRGSGWSEIGVDVLNKIYKCGHLYWVIQCILFTLELLDEKMDM